MNKYEIKNLIGTNVVIFEIGCADGIDTLEFLEAFGNEAKFYCFEPDIRNANVFKNGGYRPLRPDLKNGINNPNVIFENKAIGKENRTLIFNQSSTIYSSSLKKPTEALSNTWPEIKFDNQVIVDCVTLDKYVTDNKIQIIDFIWADVQGAEDYMIQGGMDTFSNKVRYLYTEYANGDKYYQGSPDKNDILSMLGNNWSIVRDFGTDILLKNDHF